MAFGGTQNKGKAKAVDGPARVEEGEGHVMGAGGRGRDGGGEYEMVQMPGRETG